MITFEEIHSVLKNDEIIGIITFDTKKQCYLIEVDSGDSKLTEVELMLILRRMEDLNKKVVKW